MPTTFVGLLIFVAFLTPGFLYEAQRRSLAPHIERSVLMETTGVVAISLLTNALVVGSFGLARWAFPDHTPDVGRLLETNSPYWRAHLPYVVVWATAALAASCVLALVLARSEPLRRRLTAKFTPIIVDSSSWCEVFKTDPGAYPHAGIELSDGVFVGGRVVWFSTELRETGDRELVLGPPLQIRTAEGEVGDLAVQRVIIAAREIRRIDVTYIEDTPTDHTSERP